MTAGARRAVAVVLLAAGLAGVTGCGSRVARPALDADLFVAEEAGGAAAKTIGPLLAGIGRGRDVPAIVVDYPSNGSLFPPEIVAPTFLWHDPVSTNDAWLINVSFQTNPHHVYCLTAGRQTPGEIDPRTVSDSNVFHESEYQASAKAWTPDEHVWALIKQYSKERDARVTITGFDRRSAATVSPVAASRGSVSLCTSKDPAGAPIFYRDVPLMPSPGEAGMVQPLKEEALPLVKWRLRDLSKPAAAVVMENLTTCGNCHSFSRDGRVMTMDVDGHSGDKGAHVVKEVSTHMVIEDKDIFTWNTFRGPKGEESLGLFPHVSPDGRYVIATLHETIYSQNYMDYGFLQTFYPTRGILAFYARPTGEIRALPGADDRRYVQTNPAWSPDGKAIVFLRAEARDPYTSGAKAKYANDPRETQIQYDIYRIPFNDGKGGTAEPVPGASRNDKSNTFPKFSPDGKWIVFVQCKNGLLMRPDSQLYILPARGGSPRLMTCNASRMNSWHSWSPNSRWLVFSSKRNTPYTQLFLTHIDEQGNDSPAVLIPNSTAANRAANLPEFANIRSGGLLDITVPAMNYRMHLAKGVQSASEGRLDEASTELRKSLDIKPNYYETLVTYGHVLARQGKLDEAIAFHRKAIAMKPGSWPAHLGLGMTLGLQGKLDEAIASFKKVADLDPNSESAHYYWGEALHKMGRLDEALAQYRQAAEIGPDYSDVFTGIGLVLFQQGKPAEALPYLRDALKADPEHVQSLDALAFLLATCPDGAFRDGKEAVRLAEIACRKTNHGNPEYLDTLACALAETGRFGDAARAGAQALDLARASRNEKLAAEIQAHRTFFEKQTPFHGKR